MVQLSGCGHLPGAKAQEKTTPLPSHAVFKGDTIKPGQTTNEYPVQKFYWKDPYARLVAEKEKSYSFLASIPIRNPTESNLFWIFRLRVAA